MGLEDLLDGFAATQPSRDNLPSLHGNEHRAAEGLTDGRSPAAARAAYHALVLGYVGRKADARGR